MKILIDNGYKIMLRLIIASAMLFLSSCKEPELREIKVTAEIKEDVVKKEVVGEQLPPDTNLIMGFVIPTSNRQWFIKIACPSVEFNEITPMLDKLKQTITFDDYSVEIVTYEILEGWTVKKEKGYIHSILSKPGLNATITILESQVADKTFQNRRKQSFVEVVNSWNSQLGNQPMDEQALVQSCRSIKINGNFSLLFILTKLKNVPAIKTQSLAAMRVAFGTVADKTWYLKIAGSKEAVNAEKENFEKFVQSFDGKEGTFGRPDSWTASKAGGMVKAAFVASGATVTVIPLGIQSGSLAENVNRWRGQLGLAAQSESEIQKSLQKLQAVDAEFNYILLAKSSANAELKKPAVKAVKIGEPGIRVAFATVGDTAWYIKLTGPSSTLITQKENFENFVKELKFKGREISMDAPDGWVGGQSGGMIKASYTVGDAKLTIVPLGAQSGSIESNVNRWRRQVGLGALTASAIKADLKTITVSGTPFNYLFISKDVNPTSVIAPEPKPNPEPGKVTISSKVSFDLPKGWQKLAPAGMRAVNLRTANGVEVTGISLPPIAKGVNKNVIRWCGQVGLSQPTAEQLKQYVKKIPFNGNEASFAVLKGKEKTILAVIYEIDSGVWFFKANASNADIMAEKKNFEAFIASIKMGDK